MQARDDVDHKGDDVRHDKGPAGGGENVCDLDVELLVPVVDPTTLDSAGVHAVQADDVGGGEEAVGQQAEHARNAMLGKHVQ